MLTALLSVLAIPASAHDLVASEPRSHQELSERPSAVTLAFAGDVDAGTAKVLVLDAEGRNHTVNELIVEGTNVTALLDFELPRGTYTVYYRANRTDGEPQGGAYQFSYGPGQWTSVTRSWKGADREPAVLRDTDPKGNPQPTKSPGASEPPEVEVSTRATTIAVTGPATPSPSASDGSTPLPTTTPSQPAAEGGSGLATPLWIGGGLVLAGAAGGGVLLWRRRRGQG